MWAWSLLQQCAERNGDAGEALRGGLILPKVHCLWNSNINQVVQDPGEIGHGLLRGPRATLATRALPGNPGSRPTKLLGSAATRRLGHMRRYPERGGDVHVPGNAFGCAMARGGARLYAQNASSATFSGVEIGCSGDAGRFPGLASGSKALTVRGRGYEGSVADGAQTARDKAGVGRSGDSGVHTLVA